MKTAERIFFGGPIRTMDPANPLVEAVAVRDGRILAVGSRGEIEKLIVAGTIRTDLQGRAMLPGFVEAHSHPMMSALAWGDPVVDIRAVHEPTFSAVIAKMRRRVAKAKPEEIIWFLGLDPQLHEGMEEPSRDLLDDIAPNNPIVVQTINFHGVFINSKALTAFGIDANYNPPLGGKVFAAADGLPWKFAETAAWQLCNRFYSICGEERKKRSFEDWVRKFVRAGYTTTSEIMVEPGAAPMLYALVKSRPNPLRIVGYEAKHLGGEVTVARNFGDDDFRMIGTKLHADGSVLLGNVWTTSPYLNNKMTIKGMGLPENSTGHSNISEAKLYDLVGKYVGEGWQMSVHAHGDRTIDMVLDVYERVINEVGAENVSGPLRIEHCGIMREDQIDRAIRLNVACSYFLPYIHHWGEALRDYLLGEERAAHFVPSGSASRKGMRVSYHCDSPMTWPDALVCLDVAVNRRTMRGAVLGPDQRVSMEEALKAITIDAAYQLQMEDKVGSVAVGKFADFVILGRDPVLCEADQILQIPIVGTVLGGADTGDFLRASSN
ncbi:amidohydrolase [Bradyrhizobium sp. DOA9]|uniref:amidohydrolase n=1 Tax=Bradyrhizobium sp. DOA9 TaxID=1126627 RepID=UPI00046894A4|nr:amidohydrolase [Bradyrhizobium sp. DOA9]GAJ37561.1 exoenzyme regulatory protein aepA precursor [Bradyrhizobium sp. DOA9]